MFKISDKVRIKGDPIDMKVVDPDYKPEPASMVPSYKLVKAMELNEDHQVRIIPEDMLEQCNESRNSTKKGNKSVQ